MSEFNSLPTRILENGRLRLEYLAEAGPRLVRLSYRGSPNLLAEVPDIFWDTSRGPYYPLGGHRLWLSPEVPDVTYALDDRGLQVQDAPGGVELIGAPAAGSGIRKRLRVKLDPEHPILHLRHTIVNEGAGPITLAPWAITMFRLGGTVILPQPVGNVDPHGLQSSRILVLWPYTRLDDPRLSLADDFITLRGEASVPACKLGYFNPHGWLGYWLDGLLFVKRFEPQAGAELPDRGSNTEVYCMDRFAELESLGPVVTLAPGEACVHEETWEIYEGLDQPFIPAGLRERLGA
jgi:hypothetical protein